MVIFITACVCTYTAVLFMQMVSHAYVCLRGSAVPR